MLPEGWRERSLGELLREPPRNGYSPKESASWTGTLMLGLGCLTRDGLFPHQLKHAPMGDPELGRAMLQHGDVLISRSNTREAVGFIGIYNDVGAPCIYPDLMMRLRLGPDMQDRFLVRCLQAPLGRRQIEAIASGTSGSMVKINRSSVERLRLPVPPAREQEKVADVLGTLDRAILKTEELVAKLKQMKQGLLHDLLTRGIDDNGELRDPDRNPEQFRTSPFGLIPSPWEVMPLGRALLNGGLLQTGPFGSQLHAHEYVLDDGVPVVMPQDIDDAGISMRVIARVPEEKAAQLGRHRLKPNDVVFARRGDLSRCATIGSREAGWLCGTGCLLARLPDGAIDAAWLTAIYRHPWVQAQIRGRAVGSTMVNLNTSILAALVLPFPSNAEQGALSGVLASCDRRTYDELEMLNKLRLLKQGLMDDLLTGRVRVTPLLGEASP